MSVWGCDCIMGFSLRKGMSDFYSGLCSAPLIVRLWVSWLVLINFIGFFFLDHGEAQWSLVGFFVGGVLMIILTTFFGYSRIVGLGHSPWIILIILFIPKVLQADVSSTFSLWLVVLTLSISIAVFIDIIDVVRFLGGERDRFDS